MVGTALLPLHKHLPPLYHSSLPLSVATVYSMSLLLADDAKHISFAGHHLPVVVNECLVITVVGNSSAHRPRAKQ